jgi:hypothetical protein
MYGHFAFDQKNTHTHTHAHTHTELEARRFQEPSLSKKKAAATASATTPSSTSSSERNKGSADAEARRKAMIAAVDAREKAHKQKTKPTKYVTKTTLLRQQESHVNNFTNEELKPQSEVSRQAAVAAKRYEINHANELGYNPYAAAKSTAGQARNATVTTQHGEISTGSGGGNGGGGGGGGGASIPIVAPPSNPTTSTTPAVVVDYPLPEEFEEALVTIVSSQDSTATKTGLKIARTLITNATNKNKGQQIDIEIGAKFRKVRLENSKIKSAIVDVPGNIQLMLSVGFQLIECDESNESLLMFPSCHNYNEPEWLSTALRKMEQQENLL